ncbi:hypothetical protein THAOC_04736 [Thalassiosira oceanica]|uniref:Uncharacterized protein n=1 Tax=Thalassiosira oceanica TaxID=159749 RepID=K0T997_THAOC|nr:hypothetical protein THAOC_04736 [Thalassiosira oceanica]|eukprot:EJK73629.1 hypothetical protein THAOC_04736 [Thalassiosira oceanica]
MGNVRSRLTSTPDTPDTPVPQPLPPSEVEGAGSRDRPAVAAVPPQSETPQPVTPSPDKVPGKQATKSRPSRSRSSNRRSGSGSGSRNRAAAAAVALPNACFSILARRQNMGCTKIRLGVKDARELLRDPIDPLDKDGKLGYLITPGYPIHEASVRHERSRSRESTAASAPKEHLRPALNKKHAQVEETKRELKKTQSELKEKDALIEQLRERNRKLGQTSKRRGERAEFTEEDVLRII